MFIQTILLFLAVWPSQSRFARQLSRTRESQNVTCRLLPPTFTGEVARRAGEGARKGGETERARELFTS